MTIKEEYKNSRVVLSGIVYHLNDLTKRQKEELLEAGQNHLFEKVKKKSEKKDI